MRDLRISYVVIGLNEAKHLPASLASLSKQGIARDEMEIIYVDSSSDDGSPEIAERLLDGMAVVDARYARVFLVVYEPDLGARGVVLL